MRLSSFRAIRYRSLRNAQVAIGGLNLFIGANASGKSTILDALRFLSEAVAERDFRRPVFSRGGMIHLAWAGAEASDVELTVQVASGEDTFDWRVRLSRRGYEFDVEEWVSQTRSGSPPTQLVASSRGEGWWWSGKRGEQVPNPVPTQRRHAAAHP